MYMSYDIRQATRRYAPLVQRISGIICISYLHLCYIQKYVHLHEYMRIFNTNTYMYYICICINVYEGKIETKNGKEVNNYSVSYL
jgi:hypothetical protein